MSTLRFAELANTIPLQSYPDYVLWFALTYMDKPLTKADLMRHPLFMSFDEYCDHTASVRTINNVLETLVNPLNEVAN